MKVNPKRMAQSTTQIFCSVVGKALIWRNICSDIWRNSQLDAQTWLQIYHTQIQKRGLVLREGDGRTGSVHAHRGDGIFTVDAHFSHPFSVVTLASPWTLTFLTRFLFLGGITQVRNESFLTLDNSTAPPVLTDVYCQAAIFLCTYISIFFRRLCIY